MNNDDENEDMEEEIGEAEAAAVGRPKGPGSGGRSSGACGGRLRRTPCECYRNDFVFIAPGEEGTPAGRKHVRVRRWPAGRDAGAL